MRQAELTITSQNPILTQTRLKAYRAMQAPFPRMLVQGLVNTSSHTTPAQGLVQERAWIRRKKAFHLSAERWRSNIL